MLDQLRRHRGAPSLGRPFNPHLLGVLAMAGVLVAGGMTGAEAAVASAGSDRGAEAAVPLVSAQLAIDDTRSRASSSEWLIGDDLAASLDRASLPPRLRPAAEPRVGERSAVSRRSLSRVAQLVDIVGVERGDRVSADDLTAVAAHFGVEGETPLSDGDIARTLAAHRAGVIERLRGGGVEIASSADDAYLQRIGRFLGVEVGDSPTPRQLERLARTAEVPSPVFASTARVHIHAPSRHVVLVGFHQASFPVARQLNAHERVPMRTLPSRGRSSGNRSAADVSVEAGTPVLSPVSGRVVEVDRYALYGRYPDARLRIVPDQNPQLLVTVLHVTDPSVTVGSRVEGGRTVIARQATKFPFQSQIDRFAGSYPHVHIEVRRR